MYAPKMSVEEILLAMSDNRKAKSYCDTRHTYVPESGICGRCHEESESYYAKICEKCAKEMDVCPFCLRIEGRRP